MEDNLVNIIGNNKAKVEDFPYGAQFKKLMLNAGFTKVESQELGLGIATIYEGCV